MKPIKEGDVLLTTAPTPINVLVQHLREIGQPKPDGTGATLGADQRVCLEAAMVLEELASRPEGETREAVLDEIEKLIGAVEGRHFAAIGTASSEDDKRRHGTKAAFAMELRAAIRALKRPTMNSGPTS